MAQVREMSGAIGQRVDALEVQASQADELVAHRLAPAQFTAMAQPASGEHGNATTPCLGASEGTRRENGCTQVVFTGLFSLFLLRKHFITEKI